MKPLRGFSVFYVYYMQKNLPYPKSKMSNIIKNSKGQFIIPGIVSAFLPGVGQLIKGHLKKGVAIIALGLAFYIINWVLGGLPFIGWLIGGAGFIGWVINILDAVFSKKDIKKLPIGD